MLVVSSNRGDFVSVNVFCCKINVYDVKVALFQNFILKVSSQSIRDYT